jgi:hypothetical protein
MPSQYILAFSIYYDLLVPYIFLIKRPDPLFTAGDDTEEFLEAEWVAPRPLKRLSALKNFS